MLPGLALQRLARTPLDPALVVPLGTAFCAFAFWLSLLAAVPAVFPGGLVLLLAGAWLFGRGPLERAAGPSLRGALPAGLALVALLAVAQYPWNRLDAGTGDFLLDPLVTFDSAFHVGLTHELLSGGPPQVPGVSGFPLGYHLGTDLVRAAARRWAGTDPWNSLTRLDVTLWGVALVLALRALAARLAAPPLAIALVPWTLLLTDFSFVFASNPQAHWWTDLLRGNVLLSLVYANPLVPALGLAVGALVSLSRHEETGRPGQLALAALQAAAVPFFKVFLGAQLVLGLGVAFLLARNASRRSLAIAATPIALATALLALGQGGETVAIAFDPFDLVRTTRETLGLDPVSGLRLAAAGALWLLLSLGLRLAGLGEALRALRGPALGSALAAIALSGWPLGLLFRVSAPEMLAGQNPVNDAGYLLEQSGPLLWVFAAMALARIAVSPARRLAVAAAVLLFATPGHAAVRREESGHGPRSDAGHDGARDARARVGIAARRRRAAAARRPLPRGAGGARGPARDVRALHALPHAVRLEGRPRGPARGRLWVFPRPRARRSARDRAPAGGVVPGALRQRPRPLRHHRRPGAGVRRAGSAGVPDRRSRGPRVEGNPGGMGDGVPHLKERRQQPWPFVPLRRSPLRVEGAGKYNGQRTTDNEQRTRTTDNEQRTNGTTKRRRASGGHPPPVPRN